MAKKRYAKAADIARVDVEQLRRSGKPEWAMSAAERAALRRAEYKEGLDKNRRNYQKNHRPPAPSAVTVTHVDGSVEIIPAYTPDQLPMVERPIRTTW